MARWLGWALVLLGSALVVAVTAAAILLWASRPVLDGERPLRGLSAALTVSRDADGVATVTADNRLDLARATGFLHAQERFFQMDLARRGGAGELAALVGPRALPLDRERRLFRLRERARGQIRQLPADQQTLLYAYRDGVNAGLDQLYTKPFEYFLLGQDAKPWQVEDTFLVAAAMFFMLTDEHAERALKLARMEAVLPKPWVDFLVPTRTPWDAPLQGEAEALPPVPAAELLDLRDLPDAAFSGPPASTRRLSGLGSNNFAVAGSRTRGDGALLGGDMHLGLDVPNNWYRMRFRLPAGEDEAGEKGLDMVGVTLPGLPLMIAGSNGHVAWTFTNSYGVWSERVVLERSPQGYRTPDGEEAFAVYDETLEVAGGEAEPLTVRDTRWGPAVSGVKEGDSHALRWTAAREGAINLDLMGMETARNVEQAMAVLNGAGIPPQSAVIASRSGRIAWTIAGSIPQRDGASAAQRPLPWQQPQAWRGWLDDAAFPRLIDPAEGMIATANARLLSGDDLALIGDGGYAFPARQKRLAEHLEAAGEAMDPAAALAVQSDIESRYLGHWQAMLKPLLNTPEAEAYAWRETVRALLSTAVPRASVDSAEYALLRAWNQRVSDQVLHAMAAPVRVEFADFVIDFPNSQAAVLALARQQPPHLLDPRHDSWPAMLLNALDHVIARGEGPLSERHWGAVNQLAMRHPLSAAVPGLGWLLDMPAQALPGDRDVIRVQGPRFGASQRLAVTPGREHEGVFHMPGGQSGHPLSPHYRAGHEDWVHARPSPLLPGETVSTLRLRPG